MLENVSDPLGVPLVSFLVSNRFHIFGVSQNDFADRFQNVVNRNPILPSGFHANIFAVVFSQLSRTPAQIPCESGKSLVFVGCHTLLTGRSDTGNDKRLVDIHPATDAVNNFEHNTSPQIDI